MENLREAVLPQDLGVLHGIDLRVVEATPNLFATGTPAEFFDFLNKGGRPITYILSDQEGRDVGLLALVDLENSVSLEVRDILIHPQEQGSGQGRMMMEHAERIARQLGKESIVLVTSPNNKQALGFYERLGYSIREEVADYYGDGTSRYILVKAI